MMRTVNDQVFPTAKCLCQSPNLQKFHQPHYPSHANPNHSPPLRPTKNLPAINFISRSQASISKSKHPTQPTHFEMPKEAEPSLNERQFFAKALAQDIRLDGRSLDQFRALEIEFGDEYGVVDVRLGRTRSVPFSLPFPSLTIPQFSLNTRLLLIWLTGYWLRFLLS